MNDKELLDNLNKLPKSTNKPNKMFARLAKWYWKIKHIFNCEEAYLTDPYLLRYCRKCERVTLANRELQRAYRKGGFPMLMAKKQEIDKRSKGFEQRSDNN